VLTENGVPGSQVTVVGFAEFRPVASNEDAAGRNANRRVLVGVRGTEAADSPPAATEIRR
jgi:chemotaxis protein MotB